MAAVTLKIPRAGSAASASFYIISSAKCVKDVMNHVHYLGYLFIQFSFKTGSFYFEGEPSLFEAPVEKNTFVNGATTGESQTAHNCTTVVSKCSFNSFIINVTTSKYVFDENCRCFSIYIQYYIFLRASNYIVWRESFIYKS